MRAAVCTRHGGPDAVELRDLPDPVPGPGQVVLDVAAAAVNFPDVLLVADRYQLHLDPPFVPGSECAGTVRQVGPDVTDLAVGDRVTGSGLSGCFAEQVVLPAAAVRPVPDGVDLEAAAALGVAHRTAMYALRAVGAMEAGDQVVVLGAAGGVGLAAVELAAVLGGRVVAVASSAEKRAACVAKGAAVAVDAAVDGLKERIREATGGGADLVVDPVGGPATEQAVRATVWGGQLVVVGFASGTIPALPLNLVLLKAVEVTGFTLEGLHRHRPGDMADDDAELAGLVASGRVVPHVGARFPLAETGRALAELAERRAIGKVLVLPHG